jgi:hypothetical protein
VVQCWHTIKFSQPIAIKTFKAPAPPLSLPLPALFSLTRSVKVNAGFNSRLNHTSLLDRYMRRLQDCCLIHFRMDCQVHAKYNVCSLGSDPLDKMYNDFRRSFIFLQFTYCFHCALPQNYKHNNEELSCHSWVHYQKVLQYAYPIFIFSLL